MQSLKRLIPQASSSRAAILCDQILRHHENIFHHLPAGKQGGYRERACSAGSADEMNRGYFADISELKKHGGKISMANKIIIPAMAAVKFPDIEVNYSGNKTWKLPITFNRDKVDAEKAAIPKATLLCLSFRANSQAMIDSWSGPFLGAYSDSKDLQLYEVSFIDSWFLCWSPIKQLLLRIMKKSNYEGKDTLQKQIVYSFGDHYYF